MTTIEDNDVVDIAEYAARGEKPPRGRRYRFRLDREPYVSTSEVLTGAQILAFGSLDPQHFNLFQAIRGGQRIPIAADQCQRQFNSDPPRQLNSDPPAAWLMVTAPWKAASSIGR